MINRCYSEKSHKRHPTYKECTVCDEWHNYQTFADWFDNNYIDEYHLDKDIKVEGNRVYSPAFCGFVPQSDNTIKALAKNFEFISPDSGVFYIYNLASFCRKHNLAKSNMCAVASGKRKSHKGWVKA